MEVWRPAGTLPAWTYTMGTAEIIIRLAGGVLLTAANAFFVVTEFALTRVAEIDDQEVAEDPRLERALEMTHKLEIYLTGCQLGITSSSILLGVVAEPAVTAMLRPAASVVGLEGATLEVTSVVVAVVIINLVHKVWGEQAPTYLGVERPRQIIRWAGPVHYWWVKVTYPVIMLGDGLAKSTLRLFGVEIGRSWKEAEVDVAEDGAGGAGGDAPASAGADYLETKRRIGEVLSRGSIAPDRQEEVMAALEIEHQPVSDIMLPREEIVALSTQDDGETCWRRMAEHPLTRFPVVGRDLDDYRGNLYLQAVIGCIDELRDGSRSLEEVAAEPLRMPPDLPVSQAIDRFQEAEQELALVVDGDGRVVGLLTATDAFEAIAGELRDPMD